MKKLNVETLIKTIILSTLPFISFAQKTTFCQIYPGTGSITETYSSTTMITGKTTSSADYQFNKITDAGNSFYITNKAGIDACIHQATPLVLVCNEDYTVWRLQRLLMNKTHL